MEALADTFLTEAPLDYDSDAAADELGALVTGPALSSKIGMRTATKIFKNALENRTSSKAALKKHVPQAWAPGTQQAKQRVLIIFQAFMKSLQVPDSTIPDGDHIYHFVHTILRTLQARPFNKEVPSVRTIQGLLYCTRSD